MNPLLQSRATQLIARYVAWLLVAVAGYSSAQAQGTAGVIASALVAIGLAGIDHLIHSNRGAAIANVAVDVGGQRLVSSITVEAADELGLTEGSQVTVIVKASDVILATE